MKQKKIKSYIDKGVPYEKYDMASSCRAGTIHPSATDSIKCCATDNCNSLLTLAPSLPDQKVTSCFTGTNSNATAKTCKQGTSYCAVSFILIFNFREI